MDEMIIRQYSPADREAVINLWKTCNLTKSWNNPEQDINRKLKDSPELFLVGTINDIIFSSVMAGYDGHRGWIYSLADGLLKDLGMVVESPDHVPPEYRLFY